MSKYDEMRKELKHSIIDLDADHYNLSKFMQVIDEIFIKYRGEIEQPKIGGWIPCSERLPEESGYYLVTYHEWSNGEFLPKFDDTYVKRLHYQKSEQFTGWNFPKCIDKRAEEDKNNEVIAWQPMPEAYHG